LLGVQGAKAIWPLVAVMVFLDALFIFTGAYYAPARQKTAKMNRKMRCRAVLQA